LQERKIQIESQLSDRRLELASPEIVKRFVAEMRRVLETSEFTEKRAFIRTFIKKITILGNQAVLNYTVPINGLLEEIIGILPIVQYGGRYCSIHRTRIFEFSFKIKNGKSKYP
jgi:site-specific DNA recombinase